MSTLMNTTTLRPGVLVSLKTSILGNVQYSKQTIEGEHLIEDGKQKSKWETERVIADPIEFEAAKKARSRARGLVASVCANSSFGMLCPESSLDLLEDMIKAARKETEEFNATSKMTRVSLYVITGRIAPDDVEAVRAINSECRELLAEMQVGVENLDVKSVRDAANRARNLSTMLSPNAGAALRSAIEMARAAARQIVQAGEQTTMEIDRRTVNALKEARTAFLDLDEVQATEIVKPAAKARAIEMGDVVDEIVEAVAKKPKTRARQIEM